MSADDTRLTVRPGDAPNTTAAKGLEPVPVFEESIGAALIDSARISVMAAIGLLPRQPVIVLPGDPDEGPTVHDCLDQAMQWLDAARVQTIEQTGTPPTSFHVVAAGTRCVRCGCSEEHACRGGCWWVSLEPPICSRCA